MKKKIYIAGPITGMDDGNRAAFDTAERVLREAGYETVNPHSIKLPLDVDWHVAMRKCIGFLVRCDGVALIDGWDNSEGARIEKWIAEQVRIPVKMFGEWVG